MRTSPGVDVRESRRICGRFQLLAQAARARAGDAQGAELIRDA
jgi:hypothetical protein